MTRFPRHWSWGFRYPLFVLLVSSNSFTLSRSEGDTVRRIDSSFILYIRDFTRLFATATVKMEEEIMQVDAF